MTHQTHLSRPHNAHLLRWQVLLELYVSSTADAISSAAATALLAVLEQCSPLDAAPHHRMQHPIWLQQLRVVYAAVAPPKEGSADGRRSGSGAAVCAFLANTLVQAHRRPQVRRTHG